MWPSHPPAEVADRFAAQVVGSQVCATGVTSGFAVIDGSDALVDAATEVVRSIPGGPGAACKLVAMGVCSPPGNGCSVYFPACLCPGTTAITRLWRPAGAYVVGPETRSPGTGRCIAVIMPLDAADGLTTISPAGFSPTNHKITEAVLLASLADPAHHTNHRTGQVVVQHSCWPVLHAGPVFVCHFATGDPPRHAFGAFSVEERCDARTLGRNAKSTPNLCEVAEADTTDAFLDSLGDLDALTAELIGVVPGRPTSAPCGLMYVGSDPTRPESPVNGVSNPRSPTPISRR